MKITKIFRLEIPENASVNQIRDYLTLEETKKVIDFLESSTLFEKQVKSLRSRYKIPLNGYPTDNKHSPYDILGRESFSALESDCFTLLNTLTLPEYWLETIKMFVFHNAIITPKKEAFRIIPRENTPQGRELYPYIEILERLSKRQFLLEVEKNWQEIEEAMKVLPSTPKHKMLRSDLAKRIVELHDIDSKTFAQIADQLFQELIESGDYNIINEDYVKNLYHRWKKRKDSVF